MRYKTDIEKSGEYLRLTLPLMTRQATALHPISYAVWYEVVSGINPALSAAVAKLTKDGAVLDEAATDSLYRKYIADMDEETAKRISSDVQKVLANITQTASQAGDQANRFGSSLTQLTEDLNTMKDGKGVPAGIVELLNDTHGMQSAITDLKSNLDSSRLEIEQLKQEVSRAQKDALVDPLTGLINRKGFNQSLADCMAEAKDDGPSLLMADIDHFKKVNDTYGHLFGDKVLQVVAHALKLNVKGKDTVARFGGEEFVILLPDTSQEGAMIVAENIRKTIEQSQIKRTDTNQSVAKVTISLGVAGYIKGESANDFIGRADSALYESKNQGRNRVTLA